MFNKINQIELKLFICTLLFLKTSFIYSQNFNGEYESLKTSYIDNEDSNNNFEENNRFDVFVFIEESNEDGRILIHDPRLPDKVLMYRVLSLESTETKENYEFYIYKCETLHKDKSEDDIIFYTKDGLLNLMVSNKKGSQVFHDLKLIDK